MPHRLCICQICRCGRHRCPHHRGGDNFPIDPTTPCLITEYDSNYTGDPADRALSFKPANHAYREPEPSQVKNSTNHADYVQHPVDKVRDFRPIRVYEEPTIDMDLKSMYRTEYIDRPGEKAKSYKPANRKIGGGKFRGENTYEADYIEWSIDKRQLIKGSCELNVPDAKFGNPSEAQANFIHHENGKPAESKKPPHNAIVSTEPFGNPTLHQTDYTEKNLPGKFTKNKMVYKPPSVLFGGLSNYENDYRGQQADPANSFKPKYTEYRYDDVPTGNTVHKTDFVPFPLPEKITRKGTEYMLADISMDMNTNHRLNYDWKYQKPPLPFKPKVRLIGQGLFRDATTHRADYVPFDGQRPKQIIPEEAWKLPEHKFNHITEFQAKYRGDQTPLANSFKPAGQAVSGGMFNGNTSYGADYTAPKIKECPVLTLNQTHTFIDKQNGHNLYEQRFFPVDNVLPSGALGGIYETSHDDYIKHMVSRPVRVHRELSDNVVFGEDSPTYSSTLQHDYKGYSTGAGRQPLSKKADQSADHVNFGSATPRPMVSTSQADYKVHEYTRNRPKRNEKNDFNDSGVILGDEKADYFTSNQQQYKKIDGDFRNRGEHSDLFRESAGLIFGNNPISARYLTTSQAEYKKREVKFSGDNFAAARRNHDQFLRTEGIFSGEYQPPKQSMYKESFQNGVPYGKPERVRRDLFKATDGFTLEYEYNSPRYSNDRRKRPDSTQLQRAGTASSSGTGDPDFSEIFTEEGRYSDRSRASRRNKRRSRDSERSRRERKLAQEYVGERNEIRKLTLSDLKEEVKSLKNARLDKNGLLWFPTDEQSIPEQVAADADSLPKWASSALNMPVAKPRKRKVNDREDVKSSEQTRDANSAVNNYGKSDGHFVQKSIVSSDEGLVMDEKDRSEEMLSLNSEADQSAANHLESGRFNSADSLDGSGRLSSSQSHKSANSPKSPRTGHFEMDTRIPLETAAIVSNIVQSSRKDKRRMPKLVPVYKNVDGGENVRKIEDVASKSNDIKAVINTGGEGSDKSQVKTTERLHKDQISTKPSKSTNEVKQAVVSSATVQSNRAEQQKKPASRSNSIHGSLSEKRGSVSTDRLPLQAVEDLTAERRKGRRRLGKNTQRDQNPTSTNLGGLMKQGYLEQTTTNQDAFRRKTSPSLLHRRSPIKPLNAGDDMLTEELFPVTNRPVQHTPRNVQSRASVEPPEVDSARLPVVTVDETKMTKTDENRRNSARVKKDKSNRDTSPVAHLDEAAGVKSRTDGLAETTNAQDTDGRTGVSPKSSAKIGDTAKNYSAGNSSKIEPLVVVKSSPKNDKGSKNPIAQDRSSVQQNGPMSSLPLTSAQSRRLARRSSSSHHMPANYERTRPFKFLDNQIFDKSTPFNFSSTMKKDYENFGDGPLRIQSLDRKQIRSQIGDVFNSPDYGEDNPKSARSRKRRQEDVMQTFPSIERTRAFLPRNHTIFERLEKFESRTEAEDSYQGLSNDRESRAKMVRPVEQLQLFQSDTEEDRKPRSVSQDAYQNRALTSDTRRKAIKPKSTFTFSDEREPFPPISQSQAAYRFTGTPVRQQPILPDSSSRIWSSGSMPNSARSLGLRRFSRNDSLPPISPRSLLPFSGTTTSQSNYGEPGAISRRVLMRQHSSGAIGFPGSRLSDQTTTKEDFKKYSHTSARLEVIRPRSSGAFAVGPEEKVSSLTTNKEFFKNFAYLPPIRAHSQPPKSSYPELIGPRDGQMSVKTTTQSAYPKPDASNLERPSRKKHLAQLNPVTGEVKLFEPRATENGVVLIPAADDVCPAALLVQGKGPWKFLGKEEGHLYYDVDG